MHAQNHRNACTCKRKITENGDFDKMSSIVGQVMYEDPLTFYY